MSQQDAAVQAAGFRANLAMTQRMIELVSNEYTSKERIRKIALGALVTLEASYMAMAEQAEQEAAASSGLLVMPEQGIVTL